MARRTPARHRSGPKRGQFKKTRRNAPKRRATTKRATKARRKPATSRRRPTRSRASSAASRRRRGRRNPAMNGSIWQIAIWAAGASLVGNLAAQSEFVRKLGAFAPWVIPVGTGAAGIYLARKAKTKPAGYALLGIAAAQLAQVALITWTTPASPVQALGFAQSGSGWLPRSAIAQPLPQRVRVPRTSPVSHIVVPG